MRRLCAILGLLLRRKDRVQHEAEFLGYEAYTERSAPRADHPAAAAQRATHYPKAA